MDAYKTLRRFCARSYNQPPCTCIILHAYLIDKNSFSASFANVPQPHHARTMRLNKVKLPATNEIPVDNEKRQAILVDSIFHCFWKKCEYKNSFKHVLCHFREAHGKAYLSKFSP